MKRDSRVRGRYHWGGDGSCAIVEAMRIDLLTTELRTGGAERCLTEIATGLARRGDRVRVMSLAPLPLPPRDQLLTRLLEANIEVASAETKGVQSLGRAFFALLHWMRADPPHVLQTFLYHANVLGAFAAARAGVAVRVGGVRVAQPRPQRWWVERHAVKRMQAVVCVSRSVEQFARAHLVRSESTRLLTIPNGVRTSAFADAVAADWCTYGLRPGSRVLLFLGRLHRQKGLDLLLRAAPALLRLDPDVALVIVGSGPLEREVRRTVALLPPGRAVHLPWQADVARLYAGAEVVIVPSRYEGMPNVVLEAMASGRPVVAADVEGVAELLGGAGGAQIFPRGDTAAMCLCVEKMLSRADSDAVGTANRRRAEESFSIDAMVDRYRQLYAQLVAP